MQKHKFSKKRERKARLEKLKSKLEGNSEVDYSIAPEETHNERSKTSIQKKQQNIEQILNKSPKKVVETPSKQKQSSESDKSEKKKKSSQDNHTDKQTEKKKKSSQESVSTTPKKTDHSETKHKEAKEHILREATLNKSSEQISSRALKKKLRLREIRERRRAQEMAVLQASNVPICTRTSMVRAIRGISQEISGGELQHKFTSDAIDLIQATAEDYMTEIFHNAQFFASLNGRNADVQHIRAAQLHSNNLLHVNLRKELKRHVLEPIKKFHDATFYNAEDLLEDITEGELKKLKLPERFKTSNPRPRKRRKLNESEEENTNQNTSQVEEGYTSDSV